MELLERAGPLAALDSHLASAAAGVGSVTLLAGEAGIGKTSLAEAFCAAHQQDAQVLWGGCDALSTPRPLGPLFDLAQTAGGELAGLMVSDATRHQRFISLLDALVSPLRPVIMVIDDLHWADEATLDLLVFIARRVDRTNAAVVVTYRDDELGGDHPLRVVLGNLATLASVHRLRLPRLSERAVAQLAAAYGVDAGRLYQATGGNPFFLTQVLDAGAASAAAAVPETVRDAVLARAGRLGPAARPVLAAVAVVPDRAELALVRQVADPDPADIDECEQAGLLHTDGRTVAFRHELARLAVEQTIPAARRQELHAAVLAWLAGQAGTDRARLAYHADQAHDQQAVLTHAPAAAAQAARLGAHRQAIAHYQRALAHAGALAPPAHADLLERYAEECVFVDRTSEALDAAGQALARWQEIGEPDRAGAIMARRAMYLWSVARNQEAHELARAAVAMLADRPPGPGLAAAYTYRAYLCMLADHNSEAVELGQRAIGLAERHGSTLVLARALNATGSAYWLIDPDRAEAVMNRCLEVAREAGSDRAESAAMLNYGARAGMVRRYRTAERWLQETVSYGTQRDMDSHRAYALAWLARCHLEQGWWAPAQAAAGEALDQPVLMEPTRIVALTVQGRLRTRRGEPGGPAALDQAWQLAAQTGDLQRLWPVAAGRAEAAWLADRPEQIPTLVDETAELAGRLGHPWAIGELGYWRWRAGAITTPPPGAAPPYALEIGGDWRAAAAAWAELGCPYEAALARCAAGTPEELLAALEVLHQLGAGPAADRIGHQLRTLGVRRLPRRPRRRTLDNPAGLTDRELEVLTLLAEGLPNADIAARLHISPRTADHHVAAILGKLSASSRHDAAAAARRLGLTEVAG